MKIHVEYSFPHGSLGPKGWFFYKEADDMGRALQIYGRALKECAQAKAVTEYRLVVIVEE